MVLTSYVTRALATGVLSASLPLLAQEDPVRQRCSLAVPLQLTERSRTVEARPPPCGVCRKFDPTTAEGRRVRDARDAELHEGGARLCVPRGHHAVPRAGEEVEEASGEPRRQGGQASGENRAM
eukprot:1191058-Prorocentrum_minimum.AAC.1